MVKMVTCICSSFYHNKNKTKYLKEPACESYRPKFERWSALPLNCVAVGKLPTESPFPHLYK